MGKRKKTAWELIAEAATSGNANRIRIPKRSPGEKGNVSERDMENAAASRNANRNELMKSIKRKRAPGEKGNL